MSFPFKDGVIASACVNDSSLALNNLGAESEQRSHPRMFLHLQDLTDMIIKVNHPTHHIFIVISDI